MLPRSFQEVLRFLILAMRRVGNPDAQTWHFQQPIQTYRFERRPVGVSAIAADELN